jgi:hypothetical protein
MLKFIMPEIRLRFSGLVRAQRRAEEVLRHGLPPEEIQPFQTWITGIVNQVETTCHQYQSSPEDLPAPSRRAYQFLKSLDTPDLSERLRRKVGKREIASNPRAKSKSEGGTLRVRNLIKITENLHESLLGTVQVMPPGGEDIRQAAEPILANIRKQVKKTEEICRESNSSPLALPNPSLRAYQWLRFLSQDDHLIAHLKALQAVGLQIETLRPKFPRRLRSLTIDLRFYNLTSLYHSQVKDGHLLLSANEGFIKAPPAVMESMLWAVLLPKKRQKAHLALVRNFADTPAFTSLARQVTAGPPDMDDERSRGQYYDLEASYERVNRRYFNRQLEAPRLVWGKRPSHHKFGHYQPATDTVLVSRTLDNPNVPEYVLDFIVYHELLHKQLGTRVSGGRRYSHTPTFKQAEQRFRKFEQAQAFLKSLGEKVEF